MTLLDNPIWHALNSEQAFLAEGDALARRFPKAIGPLAGLKEQSPEAYAALATLTEPGEQVVLFLKEPFSLPIGQSDWHLDVGGEVLQMVLTEQAPTLPSQHHIQPLGPADVPAMLSLTQLTKPGPFRHQTIELGGYLGIYDQGRLAAMAGERLKLPGFTEISAVCAHPDFQGKGYAGQIMTTIIHRQLQARKTPFLHARPDNAPAIRLYEKLGFRARQTFNLAVLRYEPVEVLSH